MSVALSEHLPLLASAPNGIQKLRGLILELAVRGKLVPQDPADEPANELLSRVADRKAQLEIATGSKKLAAVPKIKASECPFEVPKGWQWSRLADLTQVLNGRAYSKSELLDAGTPVLRVGNLFTSDHWYYSDLTLQDEKYCDAGDLIFSWSASFGPFIWKGPKVIYHYHIWKLSLFCDDGFFKDFLYKFLLEKTTEIKAAGHGVSMVHMTKEKMEKLPVPVPPLAEQHRIVEKVDELMALCDRLETEQSDAESAHFQLVEALLGTLTQSSGAADLASNWQRIAEQFDLLFTTEGSVDTLKKAILQMAVTGRLVPHDPSEPPVSGKLGDFVEFLNGYAFKSEWFCSTGIRLLRNVNVSHGAVDWKDAAYIPAERSEEFVRFSLKPGDLVLSLDRPIINTGLKIARITESDLPCLLLQRVAKIIPLHGALTCDYLFIWFNSRQFVDSIDPGRSNGVPHISTKQTGELSFDRPSLAEQHRIVARVDELMALCDRMKADLRETRGKLSRLAETLIDVALEIA